MRTLFLTCLTTLTLGVAAQFELQEEVAKVKGNLLVEASGLDRSYQNPNHLWTHNDSGGKPAVYLLSTSGEVKMEVLLEGVSNRDWEELVTVQEGEESYIYIAEIGDNRAQYDQVSLIKIKEPAFQGIKQISIPNEAIEVMTLVYKEGPRDAEALFFDHFSSDFVLITKREKRSMVYSFPFRPREGVTTISSKGELPDRNFTAADMNAKGEIVLKNYNNIYFFPASGRPAITRLVDWGPSKIEYTPEPQGEAMCWVGDDFYTLSEKAKVFRQALLYFERKQ